MSHNSLRGLKPTTLPLARGDQVKLLDEIADRFASYGDLEFATPGVSSDHAVVAYVRDSTLEVVKATTDEWLINTPMSVVGLHKVFTHVEPAELRNTFFAFDEMKFIPSGQIAARCSGFARKTELASAA